ncbi:hypothetical protein RAD16_07430 [Bradyrhizobium sp. 18BD]
MIHVPTMTATCACGEVEVRAFGKPIVSAACHCDDCQRGAVQIEALPNAPAVRDPHGGTAYMLFRKDRFECARGAERLTPHKLKQTSPTNRLVATCCNSAMFMNFDKGPHWVSVYRTRFHDDLPPLQARICTKFKPADVVLPDDVPSYRSFPPGFIVRLLASRIAMALGR